jgi:hypothetical protein
MEQVMTDAIEGGCLCGGVRYRATRSVAVPAYCHCRSCRRASGAPVVAWITVACDDFGFTQGEPRSYRSSPHVLRTFCPRCGTPLTYANDKYPDSLDVTTASLDAPEKLPPRDHVWTSHAISWLQLGDSLPRYAKFRTKEAES